MVAGRSPYADADDGVVENAESKYIIRELRIIHRFPVTEIIMPFSKHLYMIVGSMSCRIEPWT